MKQIEWMETWGRIKKRYPKWQPTDVETEDWCIALRKYKKEMVEDAARWVRQNYTSQIPTIKWFIIKIEKRLRKIKQEECDKIVVSPDEEWSKHKNQQEESIRQLEATDVDVLRKACIFVLQKYPKLISKPENGNPRDWKRTLRCAVWTHLYG